MATVSSGGPVAIIVGAHPYPHGNASANRMLGLARTFAEAGMSALVVNDDPRLTAVGERRPGTANGVPYMNLGAPTGSRRQRWARRRSFGARLAAVIAATVDVDDVQVVCVPSYFYTPRTRRFLRRAAPAATLIVDVVERHDAGQFPRGRLEPYFIRHRLTSWYAERTADRVIVISRALAAGPFRSRSPFVLPPTVEVADFRDAAEATRPEGPTTVTYVGSPGSKDDLSALVAAVGQLSATERAALRIVVGGVDREAMAQLPGLSTASLLEIDDVLEVVGKLDRSGVAHLLARSHYTILIRDPDAGFARFGFPTKVPESMAAGCPPIANLTSDLGDYITDGRDSLICPGPTASQIAATLRRALQDVAAGEHPRRSLEAARTADERFTAASWAPDLYSWLTADSGR